MKGRASPLRVLVLGATSAIAEAVARLYAAEGARILLVARNSDRLAEIAADLNLRGANGVETARLDLAADQDYPTIFKGLCETFGGIDHILVTYGILGDQARAIRDPAEASTIFRVNFTSAAGWALAAANYLREQGTGSLVILGSVAGDRGRRANFVYGAAKAGLATLVEGIAHQGAGRGPRIVVVKPGPTDTPMTTGMPKGGLLWSTPAKVALIVRRAADHGGPVVYAPWFWRYIMAIIKLLPATIFNKLNI